MEIVGGLLLLLGLLTRLAALALLVDMLVAIATTKLPILLKDGFWKMAHEARTDWSMLLGALFLLLVGAGRGRLMSCSQKPVHATAQGRNAMDSTERTTAAVTTAVSSQAFGNSPGCFCGSASPPSAGLRPISP